MRRVVLVTGPPAAGKTTYVQARAQPSDVILDQDAIGRAAMNRGLAQIHTHQCSVWIIRCAPGPRLRRALAQQLGAELVHLVEPEPTIVLRAARRPNPRRHIAAVVKWYAVERADPAPRTKASRVRGTTTQRGYGRAHQDARKAALRDLADGTLCGRCGQPMYRGQRLDLDHTEDRTGYRGLAHRGCNRRAGQAKATRQRAAQPKRQPAPRSRNW